LLGFLRRRREAPVEVETEGLDPRAEELKRKLVESRTVEPEPAPAVEDPESRRREVHESARETVEQMRRGR
jgi:hypothetical protein